MDNSLISTISTFDVGVIGIMMLFIIVGIYRGFTADFLGLFTWVGAIMITFRVFPLIQPTMHKFIGVAFFADLAGGFIVFILSLILLVAIAKALSNAVQGSMLAGLDRSLGIVSGGVRGGILITVFYMAALMFWKPGEKPAFIQDSRLEGYVASSARMLSHYLIPADMLPKQITKHLYDENLQPKEKTSEELVNNLSAPKPKIEKPKTEKTQESSEQPAKASMAGFVKEQLHKATDKFVDSSVEK